MKRAFLASALFVLLLAACANNPGPGRVSLLPQPRLGAGIYRLLGATATGDLSWSPDGRYLAAINGYRLMPECWLCGKAYSEIILMALQTMEKRTLLRNDGSPYFDYVSWFPDSARLAYVTEGNLRPDRFGASWSIGIDSQQDAPFMEFEKKPIWSPDGSKIAAADHAGGPGYWQRRPTIEVSDIQQNELETVFQGSTESGVSDPSWSPDGTKLAFSYGASGSWPENIPPMNVFVLDLKTRGLTQLTQDDAPYPVVLYAPEGNLIALSRYDRESRDERVVLKDLESNCEVVLPIEGGRASWSPDGHKLAATTGETIYIVNLNEFLGPKSAATGSICP